MKKYPKLFKEHGYIHVKEFIPKEVGKYLFEYLKFSSHAMVLSGHVDDGGWHAGAGDDQVPGSFAPRHGDMAFQALMRQMRPKMEELTGLSLCPTYTYVRLYRM